MADMFHAVNMSLALSEVAWRSYLSIVSDDSKRQKYHGSTWQTFSMMADRFLASHVIVHLAKTKRQQHLEIHPRKIVKS